MKVNKNNNLRYLGLSMLVLVGLLSQMANVQPVSAQDGAGTVSSSTFFVDESDQGGVSALVATNTLSTDFSSDALNSTPAGWVVDTNGASQWGVTSYVPSFTPTTGAATSTSDGNKLWVSAGGTSLNPVTDTYPASHKTTVRYELNLSSYNTSAALTFSYFNDSEDCTPTFHDGDYFRWGAATLPTGPFSGTEVSGFSGGWHQVTLDLTPYLGDPSVWVAFQFESDADANLGDGAYVDDVKLTSTGTKTVAAIATQSGYIVESKAGSNKGGLLKAKYYRVGDDSNRDAIRTILSFNTAGKVPTGLNVTSAKLNVKYLSKSGNSFTTFALSPFKGVAVFVKNGTFGTALLQLTDFNAAGGTKVGNLTNLPTAGVYSQIMTALQASLLVNNAGTTQIRLQFNKKTDGDGTADYINFKTPSLTITYSTP